MKLLAPCLVILFAMAAIVISFIRIQIGGFDWIIGGEIVLCVFFVVVNVERVLDWRRR